MTVPHGGAPWIDDVASLAVILSLLAVRPVWAVLIAFSAACLTVVDRWAVTPGHSVLTGVQNGLYVFLFCITFIALGVMTFHGVREADLAEAAALEAATSAAADAARERERGRINALVHDRVLATLLAAARSVPGSETLRRADAARALEGLQRLLVAGDEPGDELDGEAFAWSIQATTTELAPDAVFGYEVSGRLLIPAPPSRPSRPPPRRRCATPSGTRARATARCTCTSARTAPGSTCSTTGWASTRTACRPRASASRRASGAGWRRSRAAPPSWSPRPASAPGSSCATARRSADGRGAGNLAPAGRPMGAVPAVAARRPARLLLAVRDRERRARLHHSGRDRARRRRARAHLRSPGRARAAPHDVDGRYRDLQRRPSSSRPRSASPRCRDGSSPGYEAWQLGAITISLLGFALIRHYLAAWLSLLAIAVIAVGWSVATRQGWAPGVTLVDRHFGTLLVGTLFAWSLARATATFTAYQALERRTRAQERAASARAGARRAAAEAVLEQAGPMLHAIADGHPLTDADRRELLVIEGALRDQIRAPNLAKGPLRDAIADARRRGVNVLLLDEVEGRVDPGAQERAAVWLAERVEASHGERFVGRVRSTEGGLAVSAVSGSFSDAVTIPAA